MKVNVNEKYNFQIEVDHEVVKVDLQELHIDSRILSDTHAHFIYNNRSYNLEIVSENKKDKTAIVKVNGVDYRILIEDEYDKLLKQLGLDNLMANKIQDVKAPMPGLVLNVMITEGQEVQKGESLLVLEAMKMENVIKSPTSGIVKKIAIQKGDKVEKNELLIQFQ